MTGLIENGESKLLVKEMGSISFIVLLFIERWLSKKDYHRDMVVSISEAREVKAIAKKAGA